MLVPVEEPSIVDRLRITLLLIANPRTVVDVSDRASRTLNIGGVRPNDLRGELAESSSHNVQTDQQSYREPRLCISALANGVKQRTMGEFDHKFLGHDFGSLEAGACKCMCALRHRLGPRNRTRFRSGPSPPPPPPFTIFQLITDMAPVFLPSRICMYMPNPVDVS